MLYITLTAAFTCIMSYILLIGAYRGKIRNMNGHPLMLGVVFYMGLSNLALFADEMSFSFVAAISLLIGVYLFLKPYWTSSSSTLLIVAGGLFSGALVIAAGDYSYVGVGVVFVLIVFLLTKMDSLNLAPEQHNAFYKVIKSIRIALVLLLTWASYLFLVSPNDIQSLAWTACAITLVIPSLVSGLMGLQSHKIQVRLSRGVRFHGSILSLSGAYLLLIGVSAGFVNSLHIGHEFANKLTLFIILAGPLIIAVASKNVRRLIRVKISQHIFAEQIDYRTTWLNISSLFRTHRTNPQEITEPLMTLLEHREGVFIRKINGHWHTQFSHNTTLGAHDLTCIIELFSGTENTRWILDKQEAINSPHAYSAPVANVLLKSPMRWIVPVYDTDDSGEACAILLLNEQSENTPTWIMNWELRDYLSTIAQQMYWFFVDVDNAQHRSDSAQLAAFVRTSAFVVHDLKNISAQIVMLSQNWDKNWQNPAFLKSAKNTIDATKYRLQTTIHKLQDRATTSQHTSTVSLSEISSLISQFEGDKKFTLNVDNSFNGTLSINKERFQHVIGHLVRNAFDACRKTPTPDIIINCVVTDGYATISISDNGCGMSEDYIRTKLFRPLCTTKGNEGMGLGSYDAYDFVTGLGGRIDVKSSLGVGSTFTLYLPLTPLTDKE